MSDNLLNFILFIPLGILIWGILYASGEFYKKHGLFGLIICIAITVIWFLQQHSIL